MRRYILTMLAILLLVSQGFCQEGQKNAELISVEKKENSSSEEREP